MAASTASDRRPAPGGPVTSDEPPERTVTGEIRQQPKAFSTAVSDGTLTVTIHKEFDFGNLHQDWAHTIVTQHPGPFAQVQLDMSLCGRISSTFYAGLMQLHFHYTGKGSKPLVLMRPDPRMIANLKVLHLEQFFTIA
jgi:hypothetical protein